MNNEREEPGWRADWQITADLQPLEARLASLSPRPDRLDRDRLMFLAGQASVTAGIAERTTTAGPTRQGQAWPLAFVAAVAATLFVMLMVRSEKPLPPASAPPTEVNSRLALDRRAERSVLSTRDAHSTDIDELLARDEARSDDRGSTAEPFEYRSVPILTPTSWSRAILDSDSLDSSPSGASDLLQNQGAQT
jgi:hypothetical protein